MPEFYLVEKQPGLWVGEFSHFCQAGLRHGFSTRLGGVSEGPFRSMNLGSRTADNPENVQENRRRFCRAIGVNPATLVTGRQVHGSNIGIITVEDVPPGGGAYGPPEQGTDALITASPAVSLMLLFADCVPVILYDPINRAVGIVHAGWRGSVAKLAEKTLLKMRQTFGSDLSRCLAGIGPSIGPCCYEVDEAVIKPLRKNFAEWERFVMPRAEKWLLNLWEVNRVQLVEAGVPCANIAVSKICTACNTALFYSHRRENALTGRHGALVSLDKMDENTY